MIVKKRVTYSWFASYLSSCDVAKENVDPLILQMKFNYLLNVCHLVKAG